MIKFEIHNRWTGAVQFEAELECPENALPGIKLGLAVKFAISKGANLREADLGEANLREANLRGAYLRGATGNNRHIKSVQAGTYLVTYTSEAMQIGCQRHKIEDWWSFDSRRIADMDGTTALRWWKEWKPILQAILAASPAMPTGYVEKTEEAGENEAPSAAN